MRQSGFTLLEVLVALAIVAFMAVGVSQVIGQRLDIAGVAQSRELAQLCARELTARWQVEGPTADQGELSQGGERCYWRLDDEGGPLGTQRLSLYADAAHSRALGDWPVYTGARP
ncbi:type II secretion system protein [Pseudomonas sp. EpS/L25]|uniref:type II secretion system protein n=1 Tax=Pseudomonas sp. EpS/L25 TaxID=1749078 RepID=UPI00074344F4|nr:prepilin-type N-terminal cleavage/methylation domain-containing protein [Pseudomonas sp. EpS/L25]KUM41468.1 type II secretion system protein I/J [Pseudomonas sp. EpS/L25]